MFFFNVTPLSARPYLPRNTNENAMYYSRLGLQATFGGLGEKYERSSACENGGGAAAQGDKAEMHSGHRSSVGSSSKVIAPFLHCSTW